MISYNLFFFQTETLVTCRSGFYAPDVPDTLFDEQILSAFIGGRNNPSNLFSGSTRYFFQLPKKCSGEIRSIEICIVLPNLRISSGALLKYAAYDQVGSVFTKARSFSLTIEQVVSLNKDRKICSITDIGLLCCPEVTLSEQVPYSSSTFLSVATENTTRVHLLMSNFVTNLTICNDSIFEMEGFNSSECSESTQRFPFIFRLRIEPGNDIISTYNI